MKRINYIGKRLHEMTTIKIAPGRSSRRMLEEFRTLKKQFWGRHLWARGYFVTSSGNVTDEVIAQCIEDQDLEERTKDDGFRFGRE